MIPARQARSIRAWSSIKPFESANWDRARSGFGTQRRDFRSESEPGVVGGEGRSIGASSDSRRKEEESKVFTKTVYNDPLSSIGKI